MIHANPSGDQEHDPECIAMVFEFLHVIMELKMNDLVSMHPKLLSIALKWIQTDLVCSQAIAILRTIANNTEKSNFGILEPILTSIPIFTLALDNNGDNIEHNKRIASIMQLFQVLVQNESFRDKILHHLNEDTLYRVFEPLLGSKTCNINTSYEETINMYIYALSLIDKITQFNTKWVMLQRKLLEQKYVNNRKCIIK